jgi:hypothetical protein
MFDVHSIHSKRLLRINQVLALVPIGRSSWWEGFLGALSAVSSSGLSLPSAILCSKAARLKDWRTLGSLVGDFHIVSKMSLFGILSIYSSSNPKASNRKVRQFSVMSRMVFSVAPSCRQA